MVVVCAICSVSLEKGPGSNPAAKPNISGTPCGHIFHSFCINKWLAGDLATSNKCPCCRKNIPANKCISVFLDSYDESFTQDPDTDGATAGPNGAPELIPCNHLTEINQLKADLRRVNGDLEELQNLYRMQGDDYRALNHKYHIQVGTTENYLLRYKQCESFKDLYDKAEEKVKTLTEELKKYSYIEVTLRGVKHESKEDMKIFRNDENAIQTLIDLKNLLQKELESSKRNLDTFKKENEMMASQYLNNQVKLKQLEHDKLELESVTNDLREKVESMTTHTPSPVFTSKLSRNLRKSKPAGHRQLDTTILIKDSDSDDDDTVDKDVGVLKMNAFDFKLPASKSRKRGMSSRETAGNSTSDSDSDKSSKLKRSAQSQISLPSSKLVPASSKYKDSRDPTLFLSGRSSVPGVAPISPFIRKKEIAKGSKSK